ncbi:MAG: ABC transporter ATP-binding protein [Lachnospiraceae bacterium]|nr:ABC transporter ATP-binding protein [Lachnospiraceae bacterium]
MLQILLAQTGRYKLPAILTPVFTALEVLMELLVPYVIASLIDKGISAGNMKNVFLYGGIMLIVANLSLLFGILAGRSAAKASTGFARNLRDTMYRNIQTFSFSNIDKYSTAGLVTRMTTDVTNLQNAFQMCLRVAVRAPMMLVISLVMCLSINVQISSVFLVALVILAMALIYIVSHASKFFALVFRKYDDLNASVQENVSAIRVIKAFVREDHENKRFADAADDLFRTFVRTEKYVVMNGPIMMTVVYGCIIAISWLGAHKIVAGAMTTGGLTSLLSYVMSVLASLMMLSMIFVMLSMSAAAAKRITEVITEKADISAPADAVMSVPDGSIDFDDVDFSYKSTAEDALLTDSTEKNAREETLHDITLHIKSGETIGIIGSTGSGKSTLVSLISRLYDADKGTVKVGGIDVKQYDLDTLRNAVSVVLQKNVLFSGTILDNLRWGKEDATLEECREACRLACADDFIEQFPDGYETVIDQGGTNVSGGQKQRLCIARALLKSPKILVLDDSTSACDTATDARIRKAFSEMIPDTTKLIISQRISSIEHADRIIVMDNGRINAFDTPEALLENNEIYREIYDTQIKGGGDFDQPGQEV